MTSLNCQIDGSAVLVVQNVKIDAMNLQEDIRKFNMTMLEGPVECSVA
jgi:hypothetical protein